MSDRQLVRTGRAGGSAHATPTAAMARVLTCLGRNDGARLRLYCFPYAGGTAWAFSSWARDLPQEARRDIELWAVNLPLLQTQQAGLRSGVGARSRASVGAAASALCEALSPQLRAPYAFFGHSMGALLGFELAHALVAAGAAAPVHLVVSAHRAPQLRDRHVQLHRLEDERVIKRLRRLGGIPADVLNDSQLWELLPAIRADLALCENYVYVDRGPLPCPITAFGGHDDRMVNRDELSAWSVHAGGDFALRIFPGEHFFLETARPLVLRVLSRELRLASVSR